MSRATVDISKCIACNSCKMVCPVEAIKVRPEGYSFADDKCISCGACTLVCPTQCITIESIKEWYKKAKEIGIKSITLPEEPEND